MRFSHLTVVALIAVLHWIIPVILILWTWGRSYSSILAWVIPGPDPGFLYGLRLPHGFMGLCQLLFALCASYPGCRNRYTVIYSGKKSAFCRTASTFQGGLVMAPG